MSDYHINDPVSRVADSLLTDRLKQPEDVLCAYAGIMRRLPDGTFYITHYISDLSRMPAFVTRLDGDVYDLIQVME
jgi:hypothetical protein